MLSFAAMKMRAVLQNSVLVTVSLVVCLGAIEGGARVMEAMRVRRLTQSLRKFGPLDRYHPLLGWEKVPGAQRKIIRPEFSIHFEVNQHGLRGPDRDYAKPAGVRRVLLLGDSFAAGYYAEEEETLRAVLERRLVKDCGSPWEVINGGTGAYSTDQELLFYTSEGVRYDPDVVVLLFYYNDLSFNFSEKAVSQENKPYFELKGDELILRNTPVPEPEAGRHNRQNPAVPHLPPWHGSIALRMLSRRTSDSNPQLHNVLARLGLVAPNSRHPSRELSVFGVDPEVDTMWAVTDAIFRKLAAEVAARGARLMVLYVPVRFEVNESVWQLTQDRYDLGPDWDRQRVFARLARVCSDLGIPLVDPRAALSSADRGATPAYYTRDAHWTPVGNRVAAETLEVDIRATACP